MKAFFKNYHVAIYTTLVLIGAVAALLTFGFHFKWGLANEIGTWGATGDFFGGIFNPLLTFLTVLLLIKSLNSQNKSLAAQSVAIKSQQEALDTQKEELGLTREEMRLTREEHSLSREAHVNQANEAKNLIIHEKTKLLLEMIEKEKEFIDATLMWNNSFTQEKPLKNYRPDEIRDILIYEKSENHRPFTHKVQVIEEATIRLTHLTYLYARDFYNKEELIAPFNIIEYKTICHLGDIIEFQRYFFFNKSKISLLQSSLRSLLTTETDNKDVYTDLIKTLDENLNNIEVIKAEAKAKQEAEAEAEAARAELEATIAELETEII